MNHITAGLIALGVILGATTHAQALPVGIAIATAIGFSATAATIVGSIIAIGISVGLSILASALMRKKAPNETVGGTAGKLQTGGVVSRSFPFGDKAVVTHSLVYFNTFGQDGKTPNAYIALVFALSDLPIGGGRDCVAEIWANGTKVTWSPSATPGTYGIAIPQFAADGNDYMWVEVYDGTQTSADSFLVSQFASDPDRPYTSSRVGTGVAYARVICRVNDKLFSGVPTFKFVCKGVPLYDPRFDSTQGGSGSQRWDDKATWSRGVENPMAVAYNVLRGVTYGGSWFFGAQTVGARQLPTSAWFAAANECDAPISLVAGGTEKQFRCAGEIRLDMEPATVIEDLLRTCNGKLGEIGGVYKPYVGAAGVAVLSITDDDIRTNEEQTFNPFFGLQDIVNSVNGKYIEPGEGWTAKDAPALIDTGLEAEDGGRRQPVDLQFEYVPFGVQVQRLMKSSLKDYRRERRHAIPLAPEAFRLEPAVDFVSWTSARNGYTNKLFSVEAVTDMDGFMVGVQLKEVDPSDYAWTPSVDQKPIILSPTPLVLVPSQPIAGFGAEGVIISTASGVSKAGIRITWVAADIDDVVGVEFQIWNSGQTAVVFQGQTAPSTVPLGYAIVDGGVVSATTYKVRGRFVAGSGRNTLWSDYVTVTTPEVRVNWAALEAATQRGLEAITAKQKEAEDLVAQLSAQVQALEQVGLGARQEIYRQVVSVRGAASAQLLETYNVLAAADAATASTLLSLSSQVNDPSTGLPVTRAAFLGFQSTQVDINTATASSLASLSATVNDGTTGLAATRSTLLSFQSTQATYNSATTTSLNSLSAQVNDGTTGLPATRATLLSFQSTQASTNSATATSLSNLTASYNGISASGAISMVALAGSGGYSAFYEVRITAGSGSAAFRMTVDGTSGLSGIDFYASRTRFLNTSGVAFATFDATTGKLAADALDVASATSGERTEIKKTGIRVYDSGGTLRAAIGLLP